MGMISNTQTDTQYQDEDATTAYLNSLPELRRYICKLLPHMAKSGEIDDITQEVFIRAYAAKKDTKLKNGRGFLFRIARNLSFNITRKRRNFVEETVEGFVLEGVLSDKPDIEDALFQKQRLKALTDAMSKLPPKCRDAFFFRYFENLPHKEIGVRMGISTSTVEKHLAKALLHTSKAMQHYHDGGIANISADIGECNTEESE